MSEIYIAFYKKRRSITSIKTLCYRTFDILTKIITFGRYSHCEIALKNADKYDCYSASNRDGGVRHKLMLLDANDWDFVDVSHLVTKDDLLNFYSKTEGMGYDFIGLLALIAGSYHSKKRYFCSEWCADALGFDRPQKISPIALYRVVNRLSATQ